MEKLETKNGSLKWMHLGMGALLLVSFFLPWVKWQEINVKGYDLPAGNFFRISETNFKLLPTEIKRSFTIFLLCVGRLGISLPMDILSIIFNECLDLNSEPEKID